jgi:hypothetical protein
MVGFRNKERPANSIPGPNLIISQKVNIASRNKSPSTAVLDDFLKLPITEKEQDENNKHISIR